MLVSVNKRFLLVICGSRLYLFGSFGDRAIYSGFLVTVIDMLGQLLENCTVSLASHTRVHCVSCWLFGTYTVSLDFLEFIL